MALVVQIEGLESAAKSYSEASKSYDAHYTGIIDAMNIDEASWSDEAGVQWRELTDKAKLELKKIKENLDENSALLAEVARAARETQAKVKQGIDGMY